MVIPAEMQALYPFRSHTFSLPVELLGPQGEEAALHYIDEGEGEQTILCLHGNPTWSLMFRSLVARFSDRFRVLALDHLGCGASTSPQDQAYRLEDHIARLSAFIKHLRLTKIIMVAHDWGGAIGLGWAVQHPDQVSKLILLNTAAFTSKDIPWRIALCKTPVLGEWLIRRLNAFALAATTMASRKGLSPELKKAYLWPYSTYARRIAVARFVQDIPLSPSHPSYALLQAIESNLGQLNCPKLLLWGLKDFCFHAGFLQRWLEIYPDAEVHRFAAAGHYLLEDATEEVLAAMTPFLLPIKS